MIGQMNTFYATLILVLLYLLNNQTLNLVNHLAPENNQIVFPEALTDLN